MSMGHQSMFSGYIRASDGFTTLVVCAAIFSDTFIYDLIIPFIPQLLEHRLHMPNDQVQLWTSTLLGVFGGAFAVGNIIAGVLTDHLRSKRSAFLFGMITMIASSLMFFLGEHLAVIIAARALQGLSASFVWVSGLALLNSYVKASYIGTAMGYISVGTAAGEIIGPIVGGALYEHAGHFAVLGLVCGILGVDILLRLLLVDKPSSEQQQRIVTPADEEEPLLSGGAPLGANSTNNGVAPHIIEPKHINIIGFQLDKDLCATYYATCIVGTIRYAFESALVIFVIKRFSWSISTSGVILFAFLCPAALGPFIGSLTTKYGPRRVSVILFSAATVSLVALGLLTQPVAATKVSFVIAVTATGICLASITTVQSIAFSMAMKRREMSAKREGKQANTGIGFGGFSMAWTFGMFAGPLAAEVFIDHVSWLVFCVFLAACCAVSAMIMAFSWERWEIPNEE